MRRRLRKNSGRRVYFRSALCSGLRFVKYTGFSRIGFDVEPTWSSGSPDPFTWPMWTLRTWWSATKNLARISRRYIKFDLYLFKTWSALIFLEFNIENTSLRDRQPAACSPTPATASRSPGWSTEVVKQRWGAHDPSSTTSKFNSFWFVFFSTVWICMGWIYWCDTCMP